MAIVIKIVAKNTGLAQWMKATNYGYRFGSVQGHSHDHCQGNDT